MYEITLELSDDYKDYLKHNHQQSEQADKSLEDYLLYLLKDSVNEHQKVLDRKVLLDEVSELDKLVQVYCFFARNSNNPNVMKHYDEFKLKYDKRLDYLLRVK